MKTHVVYLTRYRGDKLPPWYIGSSFEENVLNGYTGSQGCHNNFYEKVNNKLQADFDIIENFGNKFTLKCKKCYNEFSTIRRHNITCLNCVLTDKKLQSIK